MTSYNGVVFDELGDVGNPTVEYADYQTAVYTANGMDGSVLSNFKRGATQIKFDLTLTGTEAERLEKMTTLANCLNSPLGSLVLPGQDGSYFEASPNVTITPARYIDGFTIPLTFIVPRGHALGEEKTVTCNSTTPTAFEVGGIAPAIWTAEVDITGVWWVAVNIADNSQMIDPETLTLNKPDDYYSASIDADTRTLKYDNTIYSAPLPSGKWPELTPGTWYVNAIGLLDGGDVAQEITLKYREALLW